jgi:hypothetical protein
MNIRGGISRNTLANANKVRDWRIYADFAQSLIQIARKLYTKTQRFLSFFFSLQNISSLILVVFLSP